MPAPFAIAGWFVERCGRFIPAGLIARFDPHDVTFGGLCGHPYAPAKRPIRQLLLRCAGNIPQLCSYSVMSKVTAAGSWYGCSGRTPRLSRQCPDDDVSL